MPLDLELLFSTEHWFDPNPGPPEPVYAIFGFVFAVLLGAGVYLYFNNKRLFGPDPFKVLLVAPLVIMAMSVGGLGVIFVLLRYLAVPYVSARVFVYLLLLATLALVAYAGYFYWRGYPRLAHAYREEAVRKRYLPRQAVLPPRHARKKKGKRRR